MIILPQSTSLFTIKLKSFVILGYLVNSLNLIFPLFILNNVFKLTFESFDKTLTDEEINPLIDNVISAVIKNHNGILRDK